MNARDKLAEGAETVLSDRTDPDSLEDFLSDLRTTDVADDTLEVIESLSVEDDAGVGIRTSSEVPETPRGVETIAPAPACLDVGPQTKSAMSDMSFHDFEAFVIRAEGGPDLRVVRPSSSAGASAVGISTVSEPARSIKPVGSAGKPTRSRAISKVRDAKFLCFIRDLVDAIDQGTDIADLSKKYRFFNNKKGRALEALGSSEFRPGDASGDAIPAEHSISATAKSLSLEPPMKTVSASPLPASVHVLCGGPRARFSRAAWRYRPWWHEKELPQTTACSYRTPADWGYTSNPLTVTLRHIAIKTLAEQSRTSVFSFKLQLAPEIEAQTKKRTDRIDWLRERVTKHLKSEFGESPPFHMVLSRGKRRSLVLLGEITLPYAHKAAARQALLKVGGWFTSIDKNALRMDLDPDNGLVNIMVKELQRTGSPITANRQIDREAKRIYEQEWRPLIARLPMPR